MATLSTKYSIGDTVYYASTMQTKKAHPCPDCLGSKKWSAASPAGREYTFACPRCAAEYQHDRDLSLQYVASEPVVQSLTIGSVRVDTSNESVNQYMCVETGVGSGNIYDEARLFQTHDEAMAAARLLAADTDKNVEWIAKLYDKTLKLSDYQMHDAIVVARDLSAKKFHWKVSDLLNDLRDAETLDEVREKIEEFAPA